jgi:hypothetical protein
MRKRHVSLRVVCRAGRRGRWSYSLAVSHLQQVSSRSRYAKPSRTNDAFNHGGQALAVADPPHQLNSFLWIVNLRSSILWFFDSRVLGTPVFLLCDRCLFFFPPILPVFFPLSWGASHCSIVSSSRRLPSKQLIRFPLREESRSQSLCFI